MRISRSLFFSRISLSRSGVRKDIEVESFRLQKKFLILKIKGIDSIAQASDLIGADVLVPKEELAALEKDEFYGFQLIGCTVLSKDRHPVGIVKDILSAGDNEMLVVEKGRSEILIPFSKTICPGIDLSKKEIVIDPPEGLLELDEI